MMWEKTLIIFFRVTEIKVKKEELAIVLIISFEHNSIFFN